METQAAFKKVKLETSFAVSARQKKIAKRVKEREEFNLQSNEQVVSCRQKHHNGLLSSN